MWGGNVYVLPDLAIHKGKMLILFYYGGML